MNYLDKYTNYFVKKIY